MQKTITLEKEWHGQKTITPQLCVVGILGLIGFFEYQEKQDSVEKIVELPEGELEISNVLIPPERETKTGFALKNNNTAFSYFTPSGCEIEDSVPIENDYSIFSFIHWFSVRETYEEAVEDSKGCLENYISNDKLTWCRLNPHVTYEDYFSCKNLEEYSKTAKEMLRKLTDKR